MKTTRLILSSLLVTLLGFPLQGRAADIDLYSSAASVTGTDLPNVLFILDNAANWNAASASTCTYDDTGAAPSLGATTGGIEQCALNNAINALPLQASGKATVNVGIMLYNKTGLTCYKSATTTVAGGNNGGCLIYPLTPMTAANKVLIMAQIKGWSGNNQQSANEATAQAMQEAWAYYAGKQGMSGTTYTSPALVGCQKNFVVFIGNAINNSGTPGDASAAPGTNLLNTIAANAQVLAPPPLTTILSGLTPAQQTLLGKNIQIPSGAYGTSGFSCSPNPYTMPNHTDVSGLYADEWARYMQATDLVTGKMPGLKKISTYTIGVLSNACKADYPALLTSMAIQGSGKYFPTSTAADIQQAILRVLNEVQAVNSVFSSSSLPVSVNTQGTFLNQIFMGMFRPDAQGNPRWTGNLKQYQFGYNPTTQQLFLADATNTSAISAAGTGFLSPNAASFWTCSNFASATAPYNVTPYNQNPYMTSATCNNDPTVGFWANNPNGVGLSWDLPDGEVVEKGAAAQMLRLANLSNNYTTAPGSTTNPRNLYTYCPSGTGCAAALNNPANVFDTSNAAITDAMLGTGSVNISSITSAATIQGGGAAPGGAGTAASVSITAIAKAGNTVTATVSAADILKVTVGTQLKIATGATKYDCNPCTITSVNTGAKTFTYTNTGGAGAATLPSTATLFSNYFWIYSIAHGLQVGQTLTISGCTLYTMLNGTVATVAINPWLTPSPNYIDMVVAVPVAGGLDNGCKYTVNTATVTTATPHGFPNGAVITIAGAMPAGYNGAWPITVTGNTTFTYQYTVPAPLAGFFGAGATATNGALTRDLLTRWVRGEDNYGDEASLCPPGTTVAAGTNCASFVNIRPSIHGDVLHSRPVVINYGGATVNIISTADSGATRTATASAADVALLGTVGVTGPVTFSTNKTCKVTVTSSTTFTYSTTGCSVPGAQTAAAGYPNVLVYYGDNGGVFHAINGNQVNPPNSTMPAPGGELWGFIPSEFFGSLKRQHDNSPALLMPSSPAGIIPTPQKKDYFIDGPTGVLQKIDALGRTTNAYLYLTMRRGGHLIYALDVTNPANPQFLWKHARTDAGFGELGQTWSLPKAALVKGYCGISPCSATNPPAPVLIFGAGYSGAEDSEAPTADLSGRGIFILDAVTGAIVWQAGPGGATSCAGTTTQASCQVLGMNYSIPSDITLLDRDRDGLIDRLYVGDVGGNVWRVDLEPTAGSTPNFWQVEKLAALGCATGPCALGTTPRKIFYPPEVITTPTYDAVFVPTGDREHPLFTDPTSTAASPNPFSVSPPYNVSACGVTNRAYLLKDTKIGKDGSGLTTITEASLFNVVPPALWDGSLSGYYITMGVCEKSVNAPLVVAGYIYFGTNTAQGPQNQKCEETLGEATGYKLSPFTGAIVAGEFEAGGLPPSPVAGIVNITLANGQVIQVPFCIGCGGEADNGANTGCGSDSALSGCKPPINVPTTRSRTYWYMENK